MQFDILSDHCSGCNTCRLVCALANYNEVNPAKAALRIIGHFPEPGIYEIQFCDQCGTCAEVCPVEAIQQNDGIYYIDSDICIGCSQCVDACPSNVMMENPDSDVPIKCISCGECVEVCPRDAIVMKENND